MGGVDTYTFLCDYIDTTVILVEVRKTECCLKSLIVKIAFRVNRESKAYIKEVHMLNSKTKNQTETETKDWVLPNGYTYLAITSTNYGTWSKAKEPFTACRDVYRSFINSGYAPPHVKKVPVVLVYCHEETTKVTSCGGYQWDNNFPPIPVGFFAITRSSMRPARKDEFDGRNLSCNDWLKEKYAQTKPSVQNPFENA